MKLTCYKFRLGLGVLFAAAGLAFTVGAAFQLVGPRPHGRQDTMLITTTMSEPPETANRETWVYRFDGKAVLINTSNTPTTALEDRQFAGATVGTWDNKFGHFDQPPGSATNHTSSAAGSGRSP